MQQCRQTHAAGCYCPIRSLPLSNFHSFSCSFPPTHGSLFQPSADSRPQLLHSIVARLYATCPVFVHVCITPSHLLPYFIASDFIFVASASSASSLPFILFLYAAFHELHQTNQISRYESLFCLFLFSCPCHCRLFKFTCFPHKSVNCSPPHSSLHAQTFTSISNFLHSLFVCFSLPSICVSRVCLQRAALLATDLQTCICVIPPSTCCLAYCIACKLQTHRTKTTRKKRGGSNGCA